MAKGKKGLHCATQRFAKNDVFEKAIVFAPAVHIYACLAIATEGLLDTPHNLLQFIYILI
jgi:hypothetical protein